MNILVRLSPALVYADKVNAVELLGDRIGLSVSDINDIVVAYVEYQWFNGVNSCSEQDIVDGYFMGDAMGYPILYAVSNQLLEIGSYIPDNLKSIRYARTHRDGFYLICEVADEHPTYL